MSLLLNALKKAEETKEESPSAEAGAPEQLGGEQSAAPVQAAVGGEQAAAPAAPVDLDSMVDEPAVGGAAAAATAAEAPQADKKSGRVDAARVFSASGGDSSSGQEGGSRRGAFVKRFVYTLLGLGVVAGGGYYVVFLGLIPGVDVNTVRTIVGVESAAPVAATQTQEAVPVELEVSDDIVLLPVPAIDIQSEIDFAYLRQPENSRSNLSDESYARQIALLTGFDINKERERRLEEQRQLLADLEASQQDGAEIDVSLLDLNIEPVEVAPDDFVFQTADASRAARLALDAATPSDRELNIVNHAVVDEEASEEQSDGASAEAASEEVAQVDVKLSQEGLERQRMLDRARDLYNSGSYVEAESLYRGVLVASPKNKDALLGLASIAVASGRYQTAIATYLDILNYYPNNPLAIAGLINLRGSGGDNLYGLEKALKDSIGKLPGVDGRLYFALGNLYAQHNRLVDAQQAYFEAFSREATNPDYAYNLAVMLDHLGKQALASQYYAEALKLSQGVQAGFNRSEIEARIKDLNQ